MKKGRIAWFQAIKLLESLGVDPTKAVALGVQWKRLQTEALRTASDPRQMELPLRLVPSERSVPVP
jgi:hypothetical protein